MVRVVFQAQQPPGNSLSRPRPAVGRRLREVAGQKHPTLGSLGPPGMSLPCCPCLLLPPRSAAELHTQKGGLQPRHSLGV